jgi:hypothetical protein
MLSAAKCRSLLEDLAVIGTKHLLFLIETKQKADHDWSLFPQPGK